MGMNKRSLKRAFVAIALLLSAGAKAAGDPIYIELGAGQALGINQSGQVVGVISSLSAGSSYTINAGSLSVQLFGGSAINNHGQVVAVGNSGSLSIWTAGNEQPLPAALGNYAPSINDSGQVASSYDAHAMLWDGQSVIELAGDYSIAYGINNAGTVVGRQYIPKYMFAMRWAQGVATRLPSVSPLGSSLFQEAFAINDDGDIVGYSEWSYGNAAATKWSNGIAVALGGWGAGYALNNIGQVVGQAGNSKETAYAALWQNGNLINLNAYLPASEIADGWHFSKATGINDSGWIVGYATNLSTGAQKAILLAIPEPSTYLLFVLGLVLVSAHARRTPAPHPAR